MNSMAGKKLKQIFIVFLFISAGALAVNSKTSQQKNIYKSRTCGIVANHNLHLNRGINCTDCHQKAKKSKESKELLVPDSKTCFPCHPDASLVEHFESKCLKCHTRKPSSWITFAIKHNHSIEVIFPHSKHIKIVCTDCHSIADKNKENKEKTEKSNPDLPGMQKCIQCHNHFSQFKARICSKCHFSDKSGTLMKKIKNGSVLKPPEWMEGIGHYQTQWYKNHAPKAAMDENLCYVCHSNNDCDKCHLPCGKNRPEKIHPDDWIQMHGLFSFKGELRCSSCHNLQMNCLPCHRKSGVAWDSPPDLNVPIGSQFHPEGWYSASNGNNAPLHSIEAKRSITSCVACHTEQDCMTCHALPYNEFSPHPKSSIWLKKCQSLFSKNPSVCYKCHSENSFQIIQCK